MRKRRVFAVAAALPLAIAGMGIAHADNVQSDVASVTTDVGTTKVATIIQGDAVTVKYWIDNNSAGGGAYASCDATPTSPVTVAITTPPSVTASVPSLTFTSCGTSATNTQSVTFSSDVPSVGYSITHNAVDNFGNYNANAANFTLVVEADSTDEDPAPIDTDGDGIADAEDKCPNLANPINTDADGDGLGDPCDSNSYAPAAGSIDNTKAAGKEGDLLEASGGFTDGDGNSSLTLSVPAGSAGTFVDNHDGTFDWSYTPADNGSDSITVTATDGEHTDATQEIHWSASNVAPTVAGFTPSATAACTASVSASFTDPGAADTFIASIDWGDGTGLEAKGTWAEPVSSPVTGSHTYTANGTYTVNVSVTDDDQGVGSTNGTTAFATKSTASAIMQPINAGAKYSTFKMGSTIPVKVTVTGCDGQPITTAAPTVSLKQIDTKAGDIVNESVDSVAATNGQQMRYSDGIYIYNLSSKLSQFTNKALTEGTYEVTVTDPSFFNDAPTARFDLRK